MNSFYQIYNPFRVTSRQRVRLLQVPESLILPDGRGITIFTYCSVTTILDFHMFLSKNFTF